MSLTKQELELARALVSHAGTIKANLVGFFDKAERLTKSARSDQSRASLHQLVKQAFALAQIGKLAESIDALQKGSLAALARTGPITVGPLSIDDLLIPTHTYSPTESTSAKLKNGDSKTNLSDFGKVLEEICMLDAYGALEKRLVGSVFAENEKLAKATSTWVKVSKEPGWSVKKTV